MAVKTINDATQYQKMRDLLLRMLNICFASAGVAIGGTATNLKTARAIHYCVNGVAYYKAITAAIVPAAAPEQAVSTFCKYLLSISGGTFTITQGNVAATAALALLPALPADSAPVGYAQVATDASTTFTAGTTDWDAAGLTDTYVDLSSVVTLS